MRTTTRLAVLASLAAQQSQQQQAQVDRFSDLVPMSDYVPPGDFDNDPNNYYPTDYRILNCWDCFEAQGKICIDAGHNSLYHHTKSSDPGNTFCCKPDYNDGYCKSGNTHDHQGVEHGITTLCSQPSVGATDEFKNVLTGNRNHQMFAFCPHTTHDKCGVPSENHSGGKDMGLKAGLQKKHVQSNEMRFKRASREDPTREYDACYYEVTLDESVLDKYNPKKLHLHISRKLEMNVYVYAGKSRMEATESLISGNEQAYVGQTFSISVDKGFLIVAYPNEGKDTEFGFNYWLEAEVKPTPEEQQQEEEEKKKAEEEQKKTEGTDAITGYEVVEVETVEDSNIISNIVQINKEVESSNTADVSGDSDETLFFILCGGAGVLLIAIIFLCFKCRNKGKIQQQLGGGGENDLAYPQATNENERSLQLEDMDYDQNQSGRPSLGKAAVFENDSEKMKSPYRQVNKASVNDGGLHGPEEV